MHTSKKTAFLVAVLGGLCASFSSATVILTTCRRRLRVLRGDSEELVWINDHGNLKECIVCLPSDADTSAATYRLSADADTRARVERHLQNFPDSLNPICKICRTLIANRTRSSNTTTSATPSPCILTRNADGIVYHLEAK